MPNQLVRFLASEARSQRRGDAMCFRAEITRAALRILDEHSHEHLSVNRLASMIGISERTLQTAFEEYFGVGPTTYLKVRMLHQARGMLKNSDPDATSVTEIAVGLGIWELGRFSHDYQMLFDELPSETLRHSNAYERLRNRFHLSESSILKICS